MRFSQHIDFFGFPNRLIYFSAEFSPLILFDFVHIPGSDNDNPVDSGLRCDNTKHLSEFAFEFGNFDCITYFVVFIEFVCIFWDIIFFVYEQNDSILSGYLFV